MDTTLYGKVLPSPAKKKLPFLAVNANRSLAKKLAPNTNQQIPNIGTGLSGVGGGFYMSAVQLGGAEVTLGHLGQTIGSTTVEVVEGMYTGVSGLVGEAGSIIGDIL